MTSKPPSPNGTLSPDTSPDSATSEGSEKRGSPRFIWIGIVGFVVTCVLVFLASSWIKPEVPPGFEVNNRATCASDQTCRLTIDVSDQHEWIGVNLAEGKRLSAVGQVDLLGRRYVIRAPAGAVNLGDVPLQTASVSPDAPWQIDVDIDGALQNPAFERWYNYSYWTHLLEPKARTFAIRLVSGEGIAYLRVVSYYCEPEATGCLTIRYRLELAS